MREKGDRGKERGASTNCWWMNCRLHRRWKDAEQKNKWEGEGRRGKERHALRGFNKMVWKKQSKKREWQNERLRWLHWETEDGGVTESDRETIGTEHESERWRGESLHLRANHWQHAFSRRTQRHTTNKGDHLSRAQPTGSFNDYGWTHTHAHSGSMSHNGDCMRSLNAALTLNHLERLEIDSYTHTHTLIGVLKARTHPHVAIAIHVNTHTAHNTSCTLRVWAKCVSSYISHPLNNARFSDSHTHTSLYFHLCEDPHWHLHPLP